MILSIPYIILPFWIGYRLLTRPRNVQDKASFQQVSFFTENGINRGSYISAHVLLNLLNELGKFISFSQ